jgi:hypothetical protein
MARAATEQGQTTAETGGTMGSSTPITDPTPAQAYAREDLVGQTERPTFVTDYEATEESAASRIDPTWAIASGALVALGGGVGGAWLYARWQRERNRPINRLRRRARGIAGTLSDRVQDVGQRLPDADEMRDTAPMSGGAAALLLGGVALARLMHVGGWGRAQTPTSADRLRAASRSGWGNQLRGLREDLDSRWGPQLRSLREFDVQAARNRMQSMSMPVGPESARPMMGMGATLAMCGAGYLIWRLLRGGGRRTPEQPTWYVGSERREHIPNQ